MLIGCLGGSNTAVLADGGQHLPLSCLFRSLAAPTGSLTKRRAGPEPVALQL